MIRITKDRLILTLTCFSVIILGSILLSIFSENKCCEEPKLIERVYETKVLTSDDFNYSSIVNRVDQIEIDIKLLKLAMEQEQSTVDFIQSDEEGGSTIKWPPRFKFQLKSPSKVE